MGTSMSQRLHQLQGCESDSSVLQAGGFVAEGRVNGSLNLSRALGDHEYKQACLCRRSPDHQVKLRGWPWFRARGCLPG